MKKIAAVRGSDGWLALSGAGNHRHSEQNDENAEDDLGDPDGSASDTAETERCSDLSDEKKGQARPSMYFSRFGVAAVGHNFRSALLSLNAVM